MLANPQTLIDPSGRTVDYLRISITDRCNERCLYCMPPDYHAWLPKGEILSYEEILEIAGVATSLGVRTFRVTGGEPLMRREVIPFLARLCALPGADRVSITTNGVFLPQMAAGLREAGVDSLNISLDALDSAIYRTITGGEVDRVLEGIDAAIGAGFRSVKLNTVLIRHRNEEQIRPLLDYAASRNIPIRFIELMPVSLTEMLDESNFLPVGEVKTRIEKEEPLMPVEERLGAGPARYFRSTRTGGIIGFISAITDLHFCDRCNKVRLTCDGKLRPCLGNHLEQDLKPALRPTVNGEMLRSLILETLAQKPDAHIFGELYQPGRIMTAIGG